MAKMTDQDRFTLTKNYAQKMRMQHSQRVDDMKKYLAAYELKSPMKKDIEDLGPHTKYVVDPAPKIKLQGAMRLLTATEMTHTVPKLPEAENLEALNMIQDTARNIWRKSGRLAGLPLEEDAVFMGLLYDEVHFRVTKTQDLVDLFEKITKRKQDKDKKYQPSLAAKTRIERLAKETPYIVENLNPLYGFPEYDRLGLRMYYSEMTVTNGWLQDTYGIPTDDPFGERKLCDMWDLEYRTIWLDASETETAAGAETILVQEEHKLPFIPIVCTLINGSRIVWNKPDQQRQPFLYTMLKGGLWDLGTLFLSVLATNAKVFGAIANFIYKGEDAPEYEATDFMGVYKVGEDEELMPMDVPVNNRAVQEMYGIAAQKATEATIFDQSLGAPGGGSDPYSKTALLHQAGRLPLVAYQRQVAMCASQAMELCFQWMRHDKASAYESQTKYGAINLKWDDIPEFIQIESRLEIDLPQDQLELANIALQLREMMGDEWVMRNVLSQQEPQRIISERSKEQFFEAHKAVRVNDINMENQLKWQGKQAQQANQIQMQQQKQQVAMQQAVQAQMGQGGPPPGGGNPGGPGGLPPEVLAEMQGQGAGQQGQMSQEDMVALAMGQQAPMTPAPDREPRPAPGEFRGG
jgi:hypothetical protein